MMAEKHTESKKKQWHLWTKKKEEKKERKKPIENSKTYFQMKHSQTVQTFQELSGDPHNLLNQLSTANRTAVYKSWHQLVAQCYKNKPIQLMMSIFERTGEKDRVVRTLFNHNDFYQKSSRGTTLYMHAKMLYDFLNAVMETTFIHDKSKPRMCPKLLGQVHGPLCRKGFKPEFWEYFGTSFSEVMTRKETADSPLKAKAWNALIAVITDRFRAAYDQEVRKYKAKRISPSNSVPDRLISSTDSCSFREVVQSAMVIHKDSRNCLSYRVPSQLDPLLEHESEFSQSARFPSKLSNESRRFIPRSKTFDDDRPGKRYLASYSDESPVSLNACLREYGMEKWAPTSSRSETGIESVSSSTEVEDFERISSKVSRLKIRRQSTPNESSKRNWRTTNRDTSGSRSNKKIQYRRSALSADIKEVEPRSARIIRLISLKDVCGSSIEESGSNSSNSARGLKPPKSDMEVAMKSVELPKSKSLQMNFKSTYDAQDSERTSSSSEKNAMTFNDDQKPKIEKSDSTSTTFSEVIKSKRNHRKKTSLIENRLKPQPSPNKSEVGSELRNDKNQLSASKSTTDINSAETRLTAFEKPDIGEKSQLTVSTPLKIEVLETSSTKAETITAKSKNNNLNLPKEPTASLSENSRCCSSEDDYTEQQKSRKISDTGFNKRTKWIFRTMKSKKNTEPLAEAEPIEMKKLESVTEKAGIQR